MFFRLFVICICLASGLRAWKWETVYSENFETFPLGLVKPGSGGWQVKSSPGTSARIETAENRGRVLVLRDNISAAQDASVRLRRNLPGHAGSYRVELAMMMQPGENGESKQDMGLHLWGPALLFDLFFSKGELRSWQQTGWASLEPAIAWKARQWYEIEMTVHPQEGVMELTIDGRLCKAVSLRQSGTALTMLELISQRFAQGELWIDDLKVSYHPPVELLNKPSAKWSGATRRQQAKKWFADEGAELSRNTLQGKADSWVSARRALHLNLDLNPVLFLECEAQNDTLRQSLFLRHGETGENVSLVARRQGKGSSSFTLFARTGWTGSVDCELIVAVQGDGKLRLGTPVLTNNDVSIPKEFSADSAFRFCKRSKQKNQLPKPLVLHLDAPAGGKRPLRCGVPFPKGVLFDETKLRLHKETGVLPLQTRVLSVWEDASIRWLLVDSVVAKKQGGESLWLQPVPNSRKETPLGQRTKNELKLNGISPLVIPRSKFGIFKGLPTPFTGEWDFVIRTNRGEFRASRGNYRASFEDNGPVRATALISGTMASGDDHRFAYELRVHVIQGLQRVEWEPTFILKGKEEEQQIEYCALIFSGNFPATTMMCGVDSANELKLERKKGEAFQTFQSELDSGSIRCGSRNLWTGKRVQGWFSTGGLTVAVRRFAEQFRKSLLLDDHELRVELWAGDAQNSRRFGRGAAKTHSILFDFSGATTESGNAIATGFETQALLSPTPLWNKLAQGMGQFPLPGGKTAKMDQIYREALEKRFSEQKRLAKMSYGMVNYGEIRHINSEIDAAVSFFLEWARTGNRRFLDFAMDWTLHSQDIDVCHYSPDPREIGIHHNHYPSDHNNGGLTLTHTWIRGQLFRYYLSGDLRTLRSAQLAGQAYARSHFADGRLFDGGNPGRGIGSRGYGRACWALSELYLATRNPAHLDTMKSLNSYLVRNLREDGAVPASHGGDGKWSSSDECPHMAAICSVGLARYMAVSGDRSFLPALERIARWQFSRGAMPEKLGMMYHNYSGGEVIHFVDACSNMLETWAFLYDETQNPLYRDLAESVYDNLLEMNARWKHDWTMGLRNILFFLGNREHWEKPMPDLVAGGAEKDASWIDSYRNEDGGYGPAPNCPSDMDSTFRALDCLRLLRTPPKHGRQTTQWILSCRGETGGYSGEPGWHPHVSWTLYALRSLRLLGKDIPETEKTAAWLQRCFQKNGGCGSSPQTGRIAYHPGWQASVDYTSHAVQALAMLGEKPPAPRDTLGFLLSNQVSAGGFRHYRGEAATVYTLDAIKAFRLLGFPEKFRLDACLAWLGSLRLASGGFLTPGTNRSNLRNTFHSLQILDLLGKEQTSLQKQANLRYLISCRAPTGGYGHTPGRNATIVHSWYALSALESLKKQN